MFRSKKHSILLRSLFSGAFVRAVTFLSIVSAPTPNAQAAKLKPLAASEDLKTTFSKLNLETLAAEINLR